ncbi:MAG: ROK family protein [Ruminococcaceae bacterium]|nr:ROK family protein [Oscillospiraceae bacterium]
MNLYLGIDLGGTRTKAGVVDETGKVYSKDQIKTQVDRDPQAIFADIADLAARTIASAGLTPAGITAMGLGSPGTSSNETGSIVFAGNLPALNGWNFRSAFHQRFNLPFYLGNDANCAALAEAVAGAARGSTSSVTVTLGTGVGGGIIRDGNIDAGFNGTGSELGHMVLIAGGEPCTCGRRGCFEVYASATALVRETHRAAASHPESILQKLIAENGGIANGRTAFIGSRAGDAVAVTVVDRYLTMVAEGVANIINFCMPEVIVLGGGVAGEGEPLLLPVRERALNLAFLPDDVQKPGIELALTGNDAGIIGAALMAAKNLQAGQAG